MGLFYIQILTGPSITLQVVAVDVEEDVCDHQEPNYHFAVSGKAFAVINEHFPLLLKKVQTQPPTHRCTFRFCPNPHVMTMGTSRRFFNNYIIILFMIPCEDHGCCNSFSPHGGASACSERDRVCSDDPRPEDPAGGSTAGHRVSLLFIFPASESVL